MSFILSSNSNPNPNLKQSSLVVQGSPTTLEHRFSNPKSPMTIMKNHKDTKDTKFFIMQFYYAIYEYWIGVLVRHPPDG
jgi:hypothetical protein